MAACSAWCIERHFDSTLEKTETEWKKTQSLLGWLKEGCSFGHYGFSWLNEVEQDVS